MEAKEEDNKAGRGWRAPRIKKQRRKYGEEGGWSKTRRTRIEEAKNGRERRWI